MKKVLLTCLAIIVTLTFCSCGNINIGFGNYAFTHIYVNTYHYNGCLDVETWREDEGSAGIEVKTKSNGTLFFSEGTYVLVEKKDACPFCSAGAE